MTNEQEHVLGDKNEKIDVSNIQFAQSVEGFTMNPRVVNFFCDSISKFKSQKLHKKLENKFENFILHSKEETVSEAVKPNGNPKHISLFLGAFNDRGGLGLKYLTHRFEKGRFDYNARMAAALSQYKELNRVYNIPKLLNGKIHGFLNNKFIVYNTGNEYDGWRTDHFKSFCNSNPGIHPVDGNNEVIKRSIQKFKDNIKIRRNRLPVICDWILKKVFADDLEDWDIKLVNLESAQFFTDVDQVVTAIILILKTMKSYSQKKDITIKFLRCKEDEYRIRVIELICHNESINSYPDDLFGGDINNAINALEGICTYEFLATLCFEETVRTYKYPDLLLSKKEYEKLDDVSPDIVHKLKFYSI